MDKYVDTKYITIHETSLTQYEQDAVKQTLCWARSLKSAVFTRAFYRLVMCGQNCF